MHERLTDDTPYRNGDATVTARPVRYAASALAAERRHAILTPTPEPPDVHYRRIDTRQAATNVGAVRRQGANALLQDGAPELWLDLPEHGGCFADGNGLYLFVQPTGTRSWVQRLVVRGRRRELGLGAVALVPLAAAREQALSNRQLARSGGDPLTERRRAEGMPTFAEAARRVLEQKQGGWRGPRHAQSWLRSLERYAFARIGARPVSKVNSADMLEILTPIWHAKAETARAVRQRIRSVLQWAVAMELRADNPCDRILPVLGLQNDVVQHMRALPHREVGAALATVRASTVAEPAVKLAFEFLVLTAARSGEVRLAT